MPISFEAFMIATAKKLGTPGFEADAFGLGMNLDRPEDWYLKLMANTAYGDKVDEAAWKKALRPEEWAKVVYLLNSGGRFAPYGSGNKDDKMASKMGKMFHIFSEDVASKNRSTTGEPFIGYPTWRSQRDSADHPVDRGGNYSLALFAYKEPWGGQSRSISNYSASNPTGGFDFGSASFYDTAVAVVPA